MADFIKKLKKKVSKMIIKFKRETMKIMRGVSGKSQLAVDNLKKIICQKSDASDNVVVNLIMLLVCLLLILLCYIYRNEIQQYIAILKHEILNEIFKLMDGIF